MKPAAMSPVLSCACDDAAVAIVNSIGLVLNEAHSELMLACGRFVTLVNCLLDDDQMHLCLVSF